MTKPHIKTGTLATIIIVAIILIDQALKIWVKTHFALGEELRITEWFRLVFVENNGMAFGWELGSKLFLTCFRIIAVGLLIYYLVKLSRRATNVPCGYVVCIAMITAGAIGNVLDCIFYGVAFGYEDLFFGRVVDMFYFPLFTWPDWVPLLGGGLFFQPVFNFADACLSVSVVVLVLFYAKHLSSDETPQNEATDEAQQE